MIVCMFVNAGMWFERFVIIVTTLARDFLPGAWDIYHPTWVDIWTFIGTFGFFLMLFLLFLRFLPGHRHRRSQGRPARSGPALRSSHRQARQPRRRSRLRRRPPRTPARRPRLPSPTLPPPDPRVVHFSSNLHHRIQVSTH